MMNQIESTGKSEGLIYNFDTMLFGDTREAHTLAAAAREAGLGTQMSEKLFSAATTEGRSIFDRDVLIALAIEAGMTESQAESALENPVFRDSVDDDEAKARAIGASGVPLFVINNKYAISGAQPAANFLSALRQVWEETKDESMFMEGMVCGIDGCK
ncbi:DsbA family oxidoreductase [Pseudocitrobacter faecalis]